MRALAFACIAAVVTAGCVDASISVQVSLRNASATDVEALVKVWDHEGKLILNRTVAAPAGQDLQVALLSALPPYRSEYTFLTHAGGLTHQETRLADGLTAWRIEVRADGISFAFEAE